MTPDRFADVKVLVGMGSRGPSEELIAELERENRAHFEDVAYECSRPCDPERPTHWPCRQPIVALVLDEHGVIQSSWCAADVPEGTPPERLIWRLESALGFSRQPSARGE